MKEYQGNLQHFIVIQTDYENERKILELLGKHDEVEGTVLNGNAVVLTSCPNCGDDEFWHYGECGHYGYEI